MLALPLDHLAYRVLDRDMAYNKFWEFGYEIEEDFVIILDDGSQAQSYALSSPLEASPDLFVSSGPEGSKIQRWAEKHAKHGGLHHMAFAVEDVALAMRERPMWDYQSYEPMRCACANPLEQVFTQPCPDTGIVYEFIHRNGHPGFCLDNVQRLMSGSPD